MYEISFSFKRAFERNGKMDAAAQVKKIPRRCELLGQLLALRGAGAQYLFDLGRNPAQLLDQRNGLRRVEPAAQLAELQRQQKQRRQLRRKSLGGRDADLRSGMRIDRAVRLARHHGVHHVADGHGL